MSRGPWPAEEYRAVVIESVTPELDGGRYPVKREVGDYFEAQADIFKEGHDALAAILKYRQAGETVWHETPMQPVGNDRWAGGFVLAENTRYVYTIEAWRDDFATWRDELARKVQAGQPVQSELLEGQALLAAAIGRASGDGRARLQAIHDELRAACRQGGQRGAVSLALGDELAGLLAQYPDRRRTTVYDRELPIVVDRERARYGAWYELFPRSQGRVPGSGGTFDDCIRRLPEIRELGFDVIYLPPIHPIGRTNRKGPNNSLVAGPSDPGCPYAIGNEQGGHRAVDPALGTIADFDRFVQAAAAHGIEIALDFAVQCSPDHPYVKAHPEWFFRRPDGTIKYAENPPKRYEDIHPLNLSAENRDSLWKELKDVLLFWIGRGVRIFRVDNPHTKPIPFWEWLIAEIQRAHPDVIFLAEAFTRPKVMRALAKAGFSQSYTYFTWRNFKAELTDYFDELTRPPTSEYLRGNLFANTPDILPAILQRGGRPAFTMRLVLAATLSSTYGIYSGFELCESEAIPGREEYRNSEKYQHKVWDWDRPGNIKSTVAQVNRIRRENPALQLYKNLRFYPAGDDHVLFYGKMTPDRSNVVLVAVNLDPFQPHDSAIEVPLHGIGLDRDEFYQVEELLSGARYLWRGAHQRIRLDPQIEPAAILRVQRWPHKVYEEPCY